MQIIKKEKKNGVEGGEEWGGLAVLIEIIDFGAIGRFCNG